MKPPVHTVKRVHDQILVMRLKAPKFFALYNTDTGELDNIQFEGRTDFPPNTEKLKRNAIASVKQALRTKAV